MCLKDIEKERVWWRGRNKKEGKCFRRRRRKEEKNGEKRKQSWIRDGKKVSLKDRERMRTKENEKSMGEWISERERQWVHNEWVKQERMLMEWETWENEM